MGEVLRACFRHFLLCFHFIRNLQIPTQESNANSTKISIYKTQFLTCNSEQKEKGRFFIKTLLQKCFKSANFDRLHHSMMILIDSIIPNSNLEVFVVISFLGFVCLW